MPNFGRTTFCLSLWVGGSIVYEKVGKNRIHVQEIHSRKYRPSKMLGGNGEQAIPTFSRNLG